jgi:iron complex transport system ATP-binding protein
VAIAARAGEVVALVGPNGSGKSTLLGVLAGDLSPATGSVDVFGEPIESWTAAELALRRSVLPQQVNVSFPFLVDDVVRMGRAPWLGTESEEHDDGTVALALQEVDITALVTRQYPSLSGGERARVALARVIAQRTQLVLLDEPTAALDVHHQEMVLELAKRRASEGAGVVVVLHDLGLAASHADRVAVLSAGRIVADGSPRDVLTPERLSDVYRHEIEVIPHPWTDELLIVPRRRRADSRESA